MLEENNPAVRTGRLSRKDGTVWPSGPSRKQHPPTVKSEEPNKGPFTRGGRCGQSQETVQAPEAATPGLKGTGANRT